MQHRQTQSRWNLRGNLVTSHRGSVRISARLFGFGLISGAEDEDDGGGGVEPRSALLRTAGPHRTKASVSLLGHSHH